MPKAGDRVVPQRLHQGGFRQRVLRAGLEPRRHRDRPGATFPLQPSATARVGPVASTRRLYDGSVLGGRSLIAHGAREGTPLVLDEAKWLDIHKRIEEIP